jgi:HAD superfamily hydrolase (TIGR01509 family)
MMQIKGLVFDFDGLILDTETAEYQSWKELFTAHHLDLPFKEWSLCVGTSNKDFDVYSYFENRLINKDNLDNLYKRREERMFELIDNLSLFPGIQDLILEAKSLGIKVAVASSAPHQWVVSHLDRLRILSYFDSIHTCEEVMEVKPHPDLYLHAIQALGIHPNQAIAFEDSPNGIKAAKAAGLYCIAVPNEITSTMDNSEADIILPSLDKVTITNLTHMLEGIAIRP